MLFTLFKCVGKLVFKKKLNQNAVFMRKTDGNRSNVRQLVHQSFVSLDLHGSLTDGQGPGKYCHTAAQTA